MPKSTDASAYSPLALTESDVERLLENKDPSALLEVTHKIANAYRSQPLSPSDIAASEQIFRLLIHATELSVRITLAETVKTSDTLPHDIAMAMARDVEEVSLPILQFSQVLNDTDLVELLHHSDAINRCLAISKRSYVSSTVSDTLLSKHSDEVTSSLIANNGAVLTNDELERIVEEYPQNESIMYALSSRAHIPPFIIEKMMETVSTTLAAKLKEKYALARQTITKQTIDSEIDKAHESETLKLIRGTHDQEEVSKLVAQLITFNRLTPSVILSALCHGNSCFFETSLARLADIPIPNARALINDQGQLGFRAVYNKSGLSDALFPAVKILLNIVRNLDTQNERPGTKQYVNRVIENILKYAEETPVENLSYLIALVRQTAP